MFSTFSMFPNNFDNDHDETFRDASRLMLQTCIDDLRYLTDQTNTDYSNIKIILEKLKSTYSLVKDLNKKTADDLRLMAKAQEAMRLCYTEFEPAKRAKHARKAYALLKVINPHEQTDNDRRRLLLNLSHQAEDQFMFKSKLRLQDYLSAISLISKIEAPEQEDYLVFSSVYKYSALLHLHKHDKIRALKDFYTSVNFLQQYEKLNLRMIEKHYRSMKCALPQGSHAKNFFNCATMLFSSPLNISEVDRIRVYAHLLLNQVDQALADPNHRTFHDNLLQTLILLRDTCQSNLFPDGKFKTYLQNTDNFNALKSKINALQSRSYTKLKQSLFSHANEPDTGINFDSLRTPSLHYGS